MTSLIAGLLIFLGVHSVRIFAPRLREALLARLGEMPWKGLYSLVAALGLILIVLGYGQARLSSPHLYALTPGLRHLVLTLMLPVFPLLLAAYLPGRIKAAVRHPMLWATVLWGAAHVLATASAAGIWLFGGFLVWALADLSSQRGRPPAAALSVKGLSRPVSDLIAVVGGLTLYALFVGGLHRWLIGVSPMPGI